MLLKHTIPILLRPKSEWLVIAGEPTTPLKLYLGYIIPLSALALAATTVRLVQLLIYDGKNLRSFMPWVLSWGLTPTGLTANYVGQLIEIYFIAALMTLLVPTVHGNGKTLHALKLLAFSFTPYWLSGLFIAVPLFSLNFSIPFIGFLYTGYLLYLGLPV